MVSVEVLKYCNFITSMGSVLENDVRYRNYRVINIHLTALSGETASFWIVSSLFFYM